MTARIGWLGVLLVLAVLVGVAAAAFLLWAWPLIADVALVLGVLAAIFAGGA